MMRRTRKHIVQIRYATDELREVDAAAARLNKTRSEYIRDAERAARGRPFFNPANTTDGVGAPLAAPGGQDEGANP